MRDYGRVSFLTKGKPMPRILLMFLFLSGFLMLGEGICAPTLTLNNVSQGTYSNISIDSSGNVSVTTGGNPSPTGNTIKGQVTTSYGTPAPITCGVPNVLMSLTGTTYTATSDSNGYYTFSGLPDNSNGYTVGASKTNYNPIDFNATGSSVTSATNVSVVGNQTATVNFSATPTSMFTISGNVMKKDGTTAFPGVTIQIWLGATMLDNTDMTDTSGNYILEGLADGITYTLKPVMTGTSFTQTSLNETINHSNLAGINFSESAGQTPSDWITLTQIKNSAFFGFHPAYNSAFSITAGQTYNFLIDPSLATPLGVGKPNIIVGAVQQGQSGVATLYRLNSDNSLGSIIQATDSGNGGAEFWMGSRLIQPPWNGERLLLKFDASVGTQIMMYWFMK